ncbi:LysR family transcriptional regulator [Agaribacterium haliotis]|uniref:LysR family transcriptional regulator n=1 Tax=Agaribacterium haliotis TaxID=2013869 RepID=UPI000BB58B71|nr:LysR family transcriptional regulator [Agaribacterium haliotis]
MDWRSINFDWNRARAFLVTAEEGSLAAAARALNLTQSTLSRQVAALERELGVSLFEKVGRKLEITPSGLELLEHVKAMSDAANQLSLRAAGKSASLEGLVRISASEANAAYVLPPILKTLREREPGIQIELIASNSSSDLRRREADIAVRNFEPTHAELIAKKLPDSLAGLYATQAYLDSLPQPLSKTSLAQAEYAGFSDNAAYLSGLKEMGVELDEHNFPYLTESHIVHWELAKRGACIGVMLELIGNNTAGLVSLTQLFKPRASEQQSALSAFPVQTWLVVHKELRSNRCIRVVFDYLFEQLKLLHQRLN